MLTLFGKTINFNTTYFNQLSYFETKFIILTYFTCGVSKNSICYVFVYANIINLASFKSCNLILCKFCNKIVQERRSFIYEYITTEMDRRFTCPRFHSVAVQLLLDNGAQRRSAQVKSRICICESHQLYFHCCLNIHSRLFNIYTMEYMTF